MTKRGVFVDTKSTYPSVPATFGPAKALNVGSRMSIRPYSPGIESQPLQRPDGDGPVAVARVAAQPKYHWLVGFAAIVVAALMATQAFGQANFPYDSIEMHPALQDETRVKQVHTVTKQFANSGQGNAASVNGYFAFYVPAKMTAPDGIKSISDLMSEAATLLGRAERANRMQVVQTLNRYIYDGMRKVVEGNHHPSARISALMMLSRLNARPANLQTRTPPQPLGNVLPILLAVYQDENNVDGLRAAALHGIHRHAMYGFTGMSPQNRDAVRKLASDLLDAPAPNGRPEKAHAYLQRFAVDILGVLTPDDDKQLATRLVSVSTKPENPNLIAMYAAERLASMSDNLQGQVAEPETVLNNWTKRILAEYESNLARIEAMERPRLRITQPPNPESFLKAPEKKKKSQGMGGMGMGGMGGMSSPGEGMGMGGMEEGMGGMSEDQEGMGGMGGMGMGDLMGGMSDLMGDVTSGSNKPQPPEVRASKKRLNTILQQVHLAVTGKPSVGKPTAPGGLLAAVTDEQKPSIETWIEAMEPIVAELNDPALDSREKWVEKITEQIEVLKEMVKEDDAAGDLGLPDDLAPQDPADIGE